MPNIELTRNKKVKLLPLKKSEKGVDLQSVRQSKSDNLDKVIDKVDNKTKEPNAVESIKCMDDKQLSVMRISLHEMDLISQVASNGYEATVQTARYKDKAFLETLKDVKDMEKFKLLYEKTNNRLLSI